MPTEPLPAAASPERTKVSSAPFAVPDPRTVPPHAAAGLYLHVPFCSAVCPYCDFAVMVGGPRRRAVYLDAVLTEIGLHAGWRQRFDTVYLGGGTPSALAPDELGRLLAALAAGLDLGAAAWIQLEANPEDVDRAALAAWRDLGVATLSLGVQSFDAGSLAFLGRRHDPEQSRRSVELARAAGFASVSLDLIYGLPGQTAAAWRRQLEQAVALAPDHISCYQLTVHQGTPFALRRDRGELAEAPEPLQAELFDLTHAFLADAGWPAYEVSNFAAAPEHRSRHNVKYWSHVPYLGLGPSAHSFDGDRRRWWNERRLGPYRGRLARGRRPVAGGEVLADADLALEALMLALRTADGLDRAHFRRRYGVDPAAADPVTAERLAEAGLVTLTAERLAPTRAGLAVADSLAAAFDLAAAV